MIILSVNVCAHEAHGGYTQKEFMLANILSAQTIYADIAFFVIIALFALLGLIRGIAKSFKGFFLSVTIILCSLLLLGVTFEPARQTPAFEKLETTLIEASSSWGDAFNMPVTIGDDGKYYVHVIVEGSDEYLQLKAIDGINGKIADWLAGNFITENGQTLGGVAADVITSLVAAAALFLGYCIGFGIIAYIIRRITRKMHSSESATVKALDRVFGAIVAAALALVFILVVLAILAPLSDKIPTVHEYLINSPVCGFFYTNNPVAKVFAKIFGSGLL